MCLAVPARIVSIGEECKAVVEVGGVTTGADVTLVPEAVVGDYVLIHVGCAIQRIDPAEARKTLALLREMYEQAGQ